MLLQLSLIKFLLMKRAFLLIGLLALASLAAYFLLSKKNQPAPEKKLEALSVTGTSGPFDLAFSRVLTSYYHLQHAFVDWDTTNIRQAGADLSTSLDSLHFNALKTDSSIIQTAGNLEESMRGELKGMNGETTIDGMRRSFNMLSDELYNLVRTVRFDGSTVYHMRCPMAFGDSSEGFWLSASHVVENPYLGNKHPVYKSKMVGCGEIIDSIQYASTTR